MSDDAFVWMSPDDRARPARPAPPPRAPAPPRAPIADRIHELEARIAELEAERVRSEERRRAVAALWAPPDPVPPPRVPWFGLGRRAAVTVARLAPAVGEQARALAARRGSALWGRLERVFG